MQRQLATSHSIPRRNPMMTPTKSKLCNPGELKKPRQSRYFLFLLPLALAACSSMPSGPNVMVLPGKGVSFEQFRADDLLCRQYAASQTGTNSNDAAINSGVKKRGGRNGSGRCGRCTDRRRSWRSSWSRSRSCIRGTDGSRFRHDKQLSGAAAL